MTAGKSALIFGATGATGKKLLGELLASNEWTRVGEYGRRVTPPPDLPSGHASTSLSKLEQKVIDFENLDGAGLRDGRWDVVFVTLGTTRAQAGSAEMFERIDREYVVNACQAAKTEDPSHEQKLVYLSSSGANASSPFLYPKSKGLTELALARLGYSDTIVFRPGFLKGVERPGRRVAETIFGYVTGAMSYFTSSVDIEVPVLVKSILNAGRLGSSHLPTDVGASKAGQENASFTVIDNKGAIALGRVQ
ncbi:hypothetical protein F5I97DRAFT_1926268 [Phlebopus sp. FC_14]|nr:hypothetical protein F5I97DRAFT_1926268 [Phlebopus sp. FC_14]